MQAVQTRSRAPHVGRFRLRRRLGAGLQGTVYLAEDPDLGREVALKLLFAGAKPGEGPPDEGRLLARLRHPNVVSVYEAGSHRGHRYLVFEYVNGRTLADRLRGGERIPVPEALPLFRRVVAAVAHAHAQKVVHLDLNPNNVMIDEGGVPRVMDFGLSRCLAAHHGRAVSAGTPLFMAPEQFDDCDPGPAVDVYALGLIFYVMVTGRYALRGDDVATIAEAARRSDYDFGALLAAGLDTGMEALVRAMLSPDPARRIPDAVELLRRLDALASAAGTGDAAPVHGTVDFLLRRMRLKKELPALATTLAEVNRLTADDSLATPARLSQVVLRDIALANRLLRLANSAYFGAGQAPIATVSEAIVRLGFEQVRVACNALLYVGRLEAVDAGASRLADRQVEGFLSGLIARHLARQWEAGDPEEAFLCAMFRRLGETLAAYCFPDECDAIDAAVQAGAAPADAFRAVLGLAPHELGGAVAREWRFPPHMAACMAPLELAAGAPSPAQRLHAVVALADAVAVAMTRAAPGEVEPRLQAIAVRFCDVLPASDGGLPALARAAGEKFRAFERVIGLRAAASTAHARLQTWLGAGPGGQPTS